MIAWAFAICSSRTKNQIDYSLFRTSRKVYVAKTAGCSTAMPSIPSVNSRPIK